MKRTLMLSILTLTALCGLGVAGDGAAVKADDPPKPVQPTAPADLIDTLSANKDCSTLVQALKGAGLVDALKGKGPFTVFAPSNEAFAHLPQGTLESLLKPEAKTSLQRMIKFHIIPATVPSADLIRLRESSKTLEGSTFRIFAKGGKVRVGPDERTLVNVIKTDIQCSNGVIHIIDGVMMPLTRDNGIQRGPEPEV